MKIAKFKHIGQCSYETVAGTELESEFIKDYVRITEFVDVDFPPRADAIVVEEHLAVLDTAEAELRSKFQAALNTIEQQRAELRAITYQA